jgi:ABC-type transport system involved in multi-copper enzyme maturation permease subunit
MTLLAIVRLTLRELASKTTMYILAGISTIVMIGTAFAVSAAQTDAGSLIAVFGQPLVETPIPQDALVHFVRQMQAGLAGGLFTGIMLFGVFATAGIFPDMMERGTVDLYLSKPIARWELLLGKYLGAVAAIGANILYFLVGAWVVFGIRTGVWDPMLLLTALIMIFMFACLFGLVTFIGTWTRNTATTIILTFLFLFIIEGPLLAHRESSLYRLSENNIYRMALDGLFYIFPQISGMQAAAAGQLSGLTEFDWKPFLQAFLSGAAFFLGGAVLFKRRDF